jgi:hypothetical protein
MIEQITHTQTLQLANRIAENIKASLFYMSELIEAHNDIHLDNQVEIERMLEMAKIKFTKPTGTLLSGLMKQYGVILVQVVPIDPNSMISMILEQGYHVVTEAYLQDFKNVILNAHEAACSDIIAAALEAAAEDLEGEGEEDDGEESGEETKEKDSSEEV